MKTKWLWSLETEAQRIVAVAKNIANRFFELNNFIVLPGKYLKTNNEIVAFPDLHLNKIPKFWQKVKKANIKNIPVTEDSKLIAEIVKLLISEKISEPNVSVLKNQWKRAQSSVIKEIERVIGNLSSVRSITIYLTNFGSSVSYNVTQKLPTDVKLFLRFDQNIHTIAEGIISSLIQNDLLNTLGANFKEKELIIDWLVQESSISKVLQRYEKKEKFIPTTASISKKQKFKCQ